jgi:hypothetical protein
MFFSGWNGVQNPTMSTCELVFELVYSTVHNLSIRNFPNSQESKWAPYIYTSSSNNPFHPHYSEQIELHIHSPGLRICIDEPSNLHPPSHRHIYCSHKLVWLIVCVPASLKAQGANKRGVSWLIEFLQSVLHLVALLARPPISGSKQLVSETKGH